MIVVRLYHLAGNGVSLVSRYVRLTVSDELVRRKASM